MTGDSSIFIMIAVMIANSIVEAAHELTFSTRAVHIVKPDRANPLTKEGRRVNDCICK